jgi:hypothetical protein
MDIGCGADRRGGGGRCRGGGAGWEFFGTRRATANRATGGYAADGQYRRSDDFGGQAMKCLFVLSVVLSAQQAIDAPPLAHVLDGEGALTPIHGLAGNFVSGRPGVALLAYSNDGDIEWRLEPGRLSATRGGHTAVFATTATRAVFRGEMAVLAGPNETLRLVGDSLVFATEPLTAGQARGRERQKPEAFGARVSGQVTGEEPAGRIAGRAIRWLEGMLRIVQMDGAVEEIACPVEPEHITAASANWAHLVIDGRPHLLRLTAGRVELFVLPQRRRE